MGLLMNLDRLNGLYIITDDSLTPSDSIVAQIT
ncbi:MAG: hypothetical protein ACI9TV_002240 [Sulfurimonas sp.]